MERRLHSFIFESIFLVLAEINFILLKSFFYLRVHLSAYTIILKLSWGVARNRSKVRSWEFELSRNSGLSIEKRRKTANTYSIHEYLSDLEWSNAFLLSLIESSNCVLL